MQRKDSAKAASELGRQTGREPPHLLAAAGRGVEGERREFGLEDEAKGRVEEDFSDKEQRDAETGRSVTLVDVAMLETE